MQKTTSLTCNHEVVKLIALRVEIFFHARDVCICDVLLAEELITKQLVSL